MICIYKKLIERFVPDFCFSVLLQVVSSFCRSHTFSHNFSLELNDFVTCHFCCEELSIFSVSFSLHCLRKRKYDCRRWLRHVDNGNSTTRSTFGKKEKNGQPNFLAHDLLELLLHTELGLFFSTVMHGVVGV